MEIYGINCLFEQKKSDTEHISVPDLRALHLFCYSAIITFTR